MSELPKLKLLIMENCEVSGNLQILTQIEELHFTSFNSNSPLSQHVGKTIMLCQTAKKNGNSG